jgi:serine/threonine protein kinase
MSVSIDEHPADEHEGADESARSVLASWLDDHAAGRCERADMEESFLSVCRKDPEASWDALALLDQYQRLGRVDAEIARDLKSRIAQLAVGAPKQSAPKPREARIEPTSGAGSSTRWRKAPAEQDAESIRTDESIHTDDIDVQPTAMRAAAPAHPPPEQDRVQDERLDDEESDVDDEADDEAADPVVMPAESIRRPPSAFADKAPALKRTPLPRNETRPVRSEPRIAPNVDARPRRSARQSAPPAAAAGKRVLRDRYELLAVLARGNTSTVYKALDRHRANLSESARYVAIKVLDADYDSRPETLAQLEREFHNAQSLSHPNIASVFDLDRDGSTYFIVMELLEGDLLTNILRRLDGRPMPRNNALGLIGSIGAALAHAHRRDIVHGDLKPRNVMVTSMGEVRVLEFGFAHARSLQGELDASHEGVSIGTPAYASAERVHGFEPDPSDDVYSLACIAYELLSGRHPYGGRSALLARAHGKRAQRISGLSQRQWHALQRALAWERAERKIDVVDLLGALGTADAPKEPVPPELLSLPDDVGARRRRMLGLVAMVVCAIALVTYFVTRIPPPLQHADLSIVVPKAPTSTDQSPPAMNTTSEEVVSPAESTAAAPKEAVPQPPSDRRPSAADRQAPAPARSEPRAEATTVAPSAAASARPETSAPPTPSSTIQFTKDTFVVTEGEPAVSLDVTRTGSARSAISFRWMVRSNSAEAGSDFAAIGAGLEQIPAGSRSATILIPLIGDSVVENTELFLVELEMVDESVALGELGHAAVIIVDDD